MSDGFAGPQVHQTHAHRLRDISKSFGTSVATCRVMATHFKSKPLSEQVVVITGASSGIGRATALAAARKKARVVLVARSADELETVKREIESEGGSAATYAADVTVPEQMQAAAEHTLSRFGGIDTWVNNAGVSIYGALEEISLADQRRVFDVTFWGMVHGTRAALPVLRGRGGTLINVGSEVSVIPAPLQGPYVAAKHALKGWTDVLRIELAKEQAPVNVSLVLPGSIDTPFFHHAKNLTEQEPAPPPPVYAPEVVAEAILHCATHVERELIVGGGARAMIGMYQAMPGTSDRIIRRTMFDAQQTDENIRDGGPDGSLYAPSGQSQVHGGFNGRGVSAYTTAVQHPWMTLLGGAALGMMVAVSQSRNGEARFEHV